MKYNEKIIELLILMIVLFISGCSRDAVKTEINDEKLDAPNNIQKIEIYHFHATNQCYSCITVGALAEKTVNTYFANEVSSGKITFAHINVDLPENKELAQKYGVTGSSLWIGVYDSTGFHKEENVNVWYKIKNEFDYTTYLKTIIDKRLVGDFS
jgi:hypothetical protein